MRETINHLLLICPTIYPMRHPPFIFCLFLGLFLRFHDALNHGGNNRIELGGVFVGNNRTPRIGSNGEQPPFGKTSAKLSLKKLQKYIRQEPTMHSGLYRAIWQQKGAALGSPSLF